jgi:hypothetical protein
VSTKYSVGQVQRWNLNHEVRFSEHALERWDERTPLDSCAPETAWDRGVDIEHPRLVEGRNSPPIDRARVYRNETTGTWAVFIVRDDVVVSVLAAATMQHGPTRAYLYGYGEWPAMAEGGDSR